MYLLISQTTWHHISQDSTLHNHCYDLKIQLAVYMKVWLGYVSDAMSCYAEPTFSISLSSSLNERKLTHVSSMRKICLDASRSKHTLNQYMHNLWLNMFDSMCTVWKYNGYDQMYCHELRVALLKLIYDRQSVGQSVLVSGAHLGPVTNFSFSLKFPLSTLH
jgi:hypothetical protein